MFRASLCPSSGEQVCVLQHMVFCTGCAGCGCVELGHELCALWKLLFDSNSNFHSAHSSRSSSTQPQPSQPVQNTICCSAHTLVLLMMGIMMPETCWGKSLILNIRLVASCWFLSLHPTFMMHGHKSLNYNVKFALLMFVPDSGIWPSPLLVNKHIWTQLSLFKVCKRNPLPKQENKEKHGKTSFCVLRSETFFPWLHDPLHDTNIRIPVVVGNTL